MKLLIPVLLLLLTFSNSCESQEKNQEIMLNYSAQTRGYIYTLLLKNNSLEIKDNNLIKKLELSESQKNEVFKMLSEINFENIKNNISTDDLAVDKAIKAAFIADFKGKLYSFDFDHNNLPKSIKQLISQLEEYSN